MEADKNTGTLFDVINQESNLISINSRCRVQDLDGYRVVSVSGIVIAHYSIGDSMNEAYAMVTLVEQGHALQKEVARFFGCSDRTVRRYQQRYEAEGMAALGRAAGYPRGRPRLASSRKAKIERWMTDGISQREIARRLGVTDKAIRKTLQRMGWKPVKNVQLEIPLAGADPNMSAPPPAEERIAEQPCNDSHDLKNEVEVGADPKLSGIEDLDIEPPPVSFDCDPSDRCIDRVLACMGLLDDAAPQFCSGTQVPKAGVLLAIPALVDSGVFDIAREVYGSIGPAFYGLRTTIMTLLLMALLRIKCPESLKEFGPQDLGRLLGLDRAPEVKTLRGKLALIAASGRATEFGRALAQRRVDTRGNAMGFLYIDGHVRAYHGKHKLPKAHLARMRISMPATTDYWVNDAEGEPLFVVTTEANAGLVKMLPPVLDEIRQLVGDRRVTVVFDRGGWSPKLFSKLIPSGFDILTYRKGTSRKVPRKLFAVHETIIEGRKISYQLADQNIALYYGVRPNRKRLKLRQVTRLSENSHQTHIITSRRDLLAIEVAYRMFDRWRQENFFKYLREEYALDALVDYGVEAADASRDVPNPKYKEIKAKLRMAHAELDMLVTQYGVEAFVNKESLRPTMRGFKIANATIAQRILDAMKCVTDLEKKRARIPSRVPVKQVTDGEVVKLSVERKHIADLFKMVAYQAESDLLRIVTPHYKHAENEGRTLIQSALATTGDIEVSQNELRVMLDPLSSPHRTHALISLCEHLNKTKTRFPGTTLSLCFDVKPEPETSLAFPGPRTKSTPFDPQPDNLTGG